MSITRNHTVSIGFHHVYNVSIKGAPPKDAVEQIQTLIKRHGIHDTLISLDAIECPICNDQYPCLQYEWSD